MERAQRRKKFILKWWNFNGTTRMRNTSFCCFMFAFFPALHQCSLWIFYFNETRRKKGREDEINSGLSGVCLLMRSSKVAVEMSVIYSVRVSQKWSKSWHKTVHIQSDWASSLCAYRFFSLSFFSLFASADVSHRFFRLFVSSSLLSLH